MSDLISREAAVAVCSAEYKECLRKSDWCGDTVAWNIGFRLKQLPAVDAVEVVHAKWVKDRDGDEYCENCSRYMPIREVTGDPSATNYCPNCGARMDGE